jgi:signal transduction histidine kinase
LKPLSQALAFADRFFEKRSRNGILIVCLIFALVIGALDFHGSPGILIFYLVPVSAAAWYGGKKVGWIVALYCAIAWLMQSLYSRAGQPEDVRGQLVDLTARLLTFLVLVVVIARLRSSIRVQKELTQFIVHDLRSPISSAITGLMTLQEIESKIDPLAQEMIDLTLVSNQRALTLVNSMLDVNKLQDGSMTVEIQKVALKELVRTSIEEVALWAQGAQIKVVTSIEVEEAYIDPNLTSRVIVNLLSNAIKFSPEGGEIRIRAFVSGERGLHVTVADDGPGIPSEYASTVFEPFSQVKGTKGGTGLGLTFCLLAVQAQHGKIWVESRVGHGTQMHVLIPRALIPPTPS